MLQRYRSGATESFSGAMKDIQHMIGMLAILLWSVRFRNLDMPVIFRPVNTA